ncbi:WD40 repeat-like protein [Polyplosphaeria fusca]|uniref:WD40 repeat-like protein n=1 Tax=Polyplosphaeria fusca TaxID=682080 RepID=A0A9P4V2T0_9PLEO|nr:WD40 repeat-like protein [Polyplosphaeria fusca]
MATFTELPSLRETFRLPGPKQHDDAAWYDVKFYPYTTPGEDPVFAVTGNTNTVICRCVLDKENCIEILRWWVDDDDDATLDALEWSRAENGDALLIVSGINPLIKIFNVRTNSLVRTLAGHGKMGVMGVNELAVSPTDTNILASCGADRSVRVWTLDPAHQKQPMAAICYGEGHKEAVLTIGFHRNGEYLLSGGQDTTVCLWRIPKFSQDELGTDNLRLIHFPHFSSHEVHSDFVDCLRFHNDLILSRASNEHQILLWRIDNFSSDRVPPEEGAIPHSQAVRSKEPVILPEHVRSGTRSAWGGRFQRLLTFSQPDSDPFFLRFTLFNEPGMRPILSAGNTNSKFFFWDLQRLEEGDAIGGTERSASKKLTLEIHPLSRAGSTSQTARLQAQAAREGSIASNASSAATSDSNGAIEKTKAYSSNIGDPFTPIPCHKGFEIKKVRFTVRYFSWSKCGTWCVAVGDLNMMAIFHRDQAAVSEP